MDGPPTLATCSDGSGAGRPLSPDPASLSLKKGRCWPQPRRDDQPCRVLGLRSHSKPSGNGSGFRGNGEGWAAPTGHPPASPTTGWAPCSPTERACHQVPGRLTHSPLWHLPPCPPRPPLGWPGLRSSHTTASVNTGSVVWFPDTTARARDSGGWDVLLPGRGPKPISADLPWALDMGEAKSSPPGGELPDLGGSL